LNLTVSCKLWTVNRSFEFWMMNRNRAKASLPPIDNKKPRTYKTGSRYGCYLDNEMVPGTTEEIEFGPVINNVNY
jgi:hypothetical protein